MQRPGAVTNVDAYIQAFPDDVQQVLRTIRQTILSVAPGAEESISYGIPTYKVGRKPVVYFAGYKNHVSLYPVTEASVRADPRLAAYRSGRGTLKFPLEKRVPLTLVKRFVGLRLREERERAGSG
jgi:uncharacterized protein YdhG (YjbR/CyaY superfamily)